MAFVTGVKLTATALNAALPLVALKTADETVNGSSTLQNDDHLAITVEANAFYALELDFVYNSGTTPDFKFSWTSPAGTTGAVIGMSHGASNIFTTLRGEIDDTFTRDGIAADAYVHITGWISTTTAGTLRFQWAQNTSNASNTIVYSGATMKLMKRA